MLSRACLCLRAVLLAAFALAAAASASAQQTVRIGKPQAGTFPFVPVDVGIAQGIFKQHGVDLKSADFAGGPKVQQAITANALDVAIGSGPELALALKGVPEIAVAA